MTTKPGAAAQTRSERSDTRSLVLNGELLIYGVIDPYLWDEFDTSVRAIDVMASLAELSADETINVRINSPGGSVIEGLAIYNALKAWGKPIRVQVDAMAASIASIIAMAGDEIVMAENATMMIHDPWAVAVGNADDLRAMADEIDRQKAILINIYAAKSGLSAEEISAMMASETYMSAGEAVARGFATSVAEAMRTAACARLSNDQLARLLVAPIKLRAERPSPAAPAAQPQETIMVDPVPGGGTPAAAPPAAPPVTVPSAPPVDTAAVRAEAVRLERERTTGILAQARSARISADDPFVVALLNGDRQLIDARADIMEEWARRQETRDDNPPGDPRPSGIVVNADSVDRWVQGAQRGLMIRAGLVKSEDADRGNEFVGLTLAEMARSALTMRGVRNGHRDRMSMVGLAFTTMNAGPGYHSSSDFGNVIQNVAYRAMMRGYEEVDESFPLWTGTGTASDFRPIARVDLGLFPNLDKVEEGAEYTYGTIADTGTTVQIASYGKMFAITRQAIINDDLGFFDRVPRRMGRAAKRTIGNLVYAILNGNPTMQDGVALFHANHGNLAGAGAAISVASVGAVEAAMGVQKDEAGIGTSAGVVPKYMLVPITLKMAANTIMTAANTPGDGAQIANPVRGLATVVADSRLSGTAWYMAADPAQTDTIEVTYLDGVQEPFMDQREGWSVDGTEFKVRMDAGVKALHWRGLYKQPGA
ncbi:ClpP-like prohead protease/major capsid protein fusion protein [Chelatococcus reniformis]|uniref:ATP-dependent Clp protease proteolytic subunit n=1 Tax=Chelatococcus reniformis TaxID=1494448 RepID=A0A916UWN6_9HYPH|nr:ClpP-like prohead protease/major capsid protein fusion protein [Chelatococcus reniformis]GGC90412.1 ATP-dependent Clp protease proteolytic subunit [Chelatococcus reniformis]